MSTTSQVKVYAKAIYVIGTVHRTVRSTVLIHRALSPDTKRRLKLTVYVGTLSAGLLWPLYEPVVLFKRTRAALAERRALLALESDYEYYVDEYDEDDQTGDQRPKLFKLLERPAPGPGGVGSQLQGDFPPEPWKLWSDEDRAWANAFPNIDFNEEN